MSKQIANIFILTLFLLAFTGNLFDVYTWGEVSVCPDSPFLDCNGDDDDDDDNLLNVRGPYQAVPTFCLALVSVSTSPVPEFMKSIFHPPKSIL
jgi:hypothetical protein